MMRMALVLSWLLIFESTASNETSPFAHWSLSGDTGLLRYLPRIRNRVCMLVRVDRATTREDLITLAATVFTSASVRFRVHVYLAYTDRSARLSLRRVIDEMNDMFMPPDQHIPFVFREAPSAPSLGTAEALNSALAFMLNETFVSKKPSNTKCSFAIITNANALYNDNFLMTSIRPMDSRERVKVSISNHVSRKPRSLCSGDPYQQVWLNRRATHFPNCVALGSVVFDYEVLAASGAKFGTGFDPDSEFLWDVLRSMGDFTQNVSYSQGALLIQ